MENKNTIKKSFVLENQITGDCKEIIKATSDEDAVLYCDMNYPELWKTSYWKLFEVTLH